MAAVGFPTSSAPFSLCSTLRREQPSMALGAPPSMREREDPLKLEGTDSAIPATIETLTQTPPQVVTPDGTPSFTHITHPLLQPMMPDTRGSEPVHVPPRVVPTRLLDKLLPLQKKMNTALEQLPTNRATGHLCCIELDLNAELAACLNEAQATKAIKQAEVHYATTACTLQQTQR